MARSFDGTTDAVNLSAGALANSSRALTVVTLVRPIDPSFSSLSTNFDILAGRASTSTRWAQFVSSKRHFGTGDFGGGGADLASQAVWYKLITRRASGGSVAYRHGIAALGGGWTWSNGSTVGNDPADVDNLRFGSPAVINNCKMHIAAAAVWAGDAFGSDGAAEAVITDDMNDWMAATPLAAWDFTQASTSNPVLDLTGGGADQTSLSGTTVVADPAGFTFFSGGVNGVATAVLGALSAAAVGSRAKAGAAVASLGALSAAAAGERRKFGQAVAALGALAASTTATRAKAGTATATLGGLTAHAVVPGSGTTIPPRDEGTVAPRAAGVVEPRVTVWP